MTRRLSLCALLAFALTACRDAPPPVPDAPCTHAGDLCRLPSGPMGICSETTASTCATPPCLACTSQH